MQSEPRPEHQWLHKLVGQWTYQSESVLAPGEPPLKSEGTEVVRSLGGLWTIGEGEGESPDGTRMKSVMTLGFDPALGRFIGTFIVDSMTYLWTYNGALDADEKILSLDAEGPGFTGVGMSKYVDSLEFIDHDHRVLSSRVQGEDGQWTHFMTVHYHRKKSG